MNARPDPISFGDFAPIIVPAGAGDGLLIGMLTAYFDDSGTHDESDVVVWAGLFGNEHQWAALDEDWAAKLRDPSPGKEPIRRFHMWDCNQGIGEFLGWSRTAREFLAHELGQIILKKMLWGYGCAIARKDYDDLVEGDRRVVMGDAEGFCMRNCYFRAVRWARERASYDPTMSFVFDDRPHRRAENRQIFNMFEHNRQDRGLKPELAALAFSSAAKFRPLQAADLFAWEFYQHAKDILKGIDEPQRPPFIRLAGGGRFDCQIATRKELEMINQQDLGKDAWYAEIAGAWDQMGRA